MTVTEVRQFVCNQCSSLIQIQLDDAPDPGWLGLRVNEYHGNVKRFGHFCSIECACDWLRGRERA